MLTATIQYNENFQTSKHTKESLKYDFLTSKSKILKINNNYISNVAILEKKIQFHLINTYSPESYEWIVDMPKSFGEIVESLLLLGDYKKAVKKIFEEKIEPVVTEEEMDRTIMELRQMRAHSKMHDDGVSLDNKEVKN